MGVSGWRRTALALLPLALLLILVAVKAYRTFDPAISGDYDAQIDYLRWLQVHHWPPHADQGFAFYHPPLYYGASVITAKLAGLTLTDGGRAVATVAWILEGVVAAVIVIRLGGRWVGASAAAALVWLLPGQANVATRIYPETAAGLGVAVLLLAVVALRQGRRSGYVWLGIGAPLAGLSKFSGLLALVVVVPVLVWTHRDRLRPLVTALAPGGVLLAAFYGRNVALYGTPTPLNADLFHLDQLGGLYAHYPVGFFTRIALGRCAAKHSFYGSAWKWLWATDCGVKPPWRDTVGGWLLVVALLTSALVLASWLWAAGAGRSHLGWVCSAAIPALVLVGFVAYNARVPSGSSGLYLLVGIVPVAVAVGGLVSRLASRRYELVTYVGVVAWGVAIAHASGVP